MFLRLQPQKVNHQELRMIDTETLDNIKTLWASLDLVCQLQLFLVNQGWHELTREERPGLKTTEAVYQDVPVPAVTQYGWTETKREVISPRQFVAWVRTPCKAYGQYVLLLGPAWLSKTLLWDSRRM
jgi:hypothetical protein